MTSTLLLLLFGTYTSAGSARTTGLVDRNGEHAARPVPGDRRG